MFGILIKVSYCLYFFLIHWLRKINITYVYFRILFSLSSTLKKEENIESLKYEA